MSKKSTLTALSAVALLSFGSAYAAQGKQDKAQKGDQSRAKAAMSLEVEPAPVRIIRQPIAKNDAMQSGVTEEQWTRADKNGDGSLDTQEIGAPAPATDVSQQPTWSGQKSKKQDSSQQDSQKQKYEQSPQ